jgi:hypothetical protein
MKKKSFNTVIIFFLHSIHTTQLSRLKKPSSDGFSGTPGTPIKPNHLEIMGNGSHGRSTNGNLSDFICFDHSLEAVQIGNWFSCKLT